MDVQTGSAPNFFVTSDVAFEVAIFNAAGNIMDASTLQAIEMDLIDDPATGNVLASASTTDIEQIVLIADWLNGVDQQAVLTLSPADMANIDFAGEPSRRVWLVFHALTLDSTQVALGTGWITLRYGVPFGVRLPLAPPPSVIPAGSIYYIPAGITVSFPTAPTILGDLVLESATDRFPSGNFVILAP